MWFKIEESPDKWYNAINSIIPTLFYKMYNNEASTETMNPSKKIYDHPNTSNSIPSQSNYPSETTGTR